VKRFSDTALRTDDLAQKETLVSSPKPEEESYGEVSNAAEVHSEPHGETMYFQVCSEPNANANAIIL
jgi:hypothetical protein